MSENEDGVGDGGGEREREKKNAMPIGKKILTLYALQCKVCGRQRYGNGVVRWSNLELQAVLTIASCLANDDNGCGPGHSTMLKYRNNIDKCSRINVNKYDSWTAERGWTLWMWTIILSVR